MMIVIVNSSLTHLSFHQTRSMFNIEQKVAVPSTQQSQMSSNKSKRRSRSNERLSKSKSRRNDRESSSSSSGPNHDGDRDSMDDEDDDASISDRSSRGNSTIRQPDGVRWDHRINLIGQRVRESKVLCCLNCLYPVLTVGRLIPCKHAAYCFQCANESRNQRRNCPKCSEPITNVEKIEAKNLILCYHGTHPNGQDTCLRGYTSQRDLQAHVKRRHESVHLDSSHQLLGSNHPSSSSFSGLMADPQQPSPIQTSNMGPQTLVPPPLMAFPPLGAPPPPPLFDSVFRPANYPLPSNQPFVPPQAQYRPPAPYQTGRSFY